MFKRINLKKKRKRENAFKINCTIFARLSYQFGNSTKFWILLEKPKMTLKTSHKNIHPNIQFLQQAMDKML